MAELTIHQKKEWAKLLYTSEHYTQKAVAEKVGVSEKTMCRWVKEGRWEEYRQTLLTTKREIIRRLHRQLDALVQKAEEAGYMNTKDADVITKITASINNLETETGLKEIIDVGMKFISWAQKHNYQAAKQAADLYDEFIKDHLNTFKPV
jgi:DNA-binding XRE family transcriptional regulator